MNAKLGERAVLMVISAGMPGESHTDREFSEKVKTQEHLGKKSGAWVKSKYPDWALDPLKKVRSKAKAFHDALTLPYAKGIGILPAALIMEYGDRMRDLQAQYQNLAETHFRPRYPEIIEWAKAEHNGTFNPADYPDIEEVMDKFYLRTEPLPVPNADHFAETMKSLLGVDTESVNIRVRDAVKEGQRILLRRMIEPVKAMATRLAEDPKPNKRGKVPKSPRFNDSLIGNLKEIIELAPKLNLADDPMINQFVNEMKDLALFEPDKLRKMESTRKAIAADAAAMLKKLEGYTI